MIRARAHRSSYSSTPILVRCSSMKSIGVIDDTDRSRSPSPVPALVVEGVPFGSSRSSRARGVAGDVVDVDGGRRRGKRAREGYVDVVVVVVDVDVVVVERVVVGDGGGDGGERVVGDERERVVDESAEEDRERARERRTRAWIRRTGGRGADAGELGI